MKVAILTNENSRIMAIASATGILEETNTQLERLDRKPVFEIEMISATHKNVHPCMHVMLNCHKNIEEVKTVYDLIIVPAFYKPSELTGPHQNFIPFIQQQYKAGAEIATMCTGAFLLAEAGLLNDVPVTTHWGYKEQFEKMYPQINLKSDRIITDSKGIYTSGAAISSFNMMIYLVEKFVDREMAILMSKIMAIDYGRTSQSYFAIFNTQKNHNDDSIKNAQSFIEEEYKNDLSVEKLADTFAMSKRNFIRRFKKATNNTPIQYIQRVKIEAAKKSLESGVTSINTIMYDVGYNDLNTFRDTFKKYTGITPVEYKRKYSAVLE